VGKYLNSTKARCAIRKDTGIAETRRTRAPTPPSLPEGAFFLTMNKTKKRAAKRAALKTTTTTLQRPNRRGGFIWPMSLDPQYKIRNLKAYREYHGCTLGQAKEAVETAMIQLQLRW